MDNVEEYEEYTEKKQGGMAMILSALCIVKNEEENLPKWLAGMKKIADEIIVTDTGSTDNTQTIIKKAGAKLCTYSWCEDFAAARNFTLEQAKGDTIVFLDADEYYPDEVLKKLRLRVDSIFRNSQVVGILAPRINIDAEAGNRFLDVSPQLRIFRSGIKYQGRIHENLMVPPNMRLLQDENLYFYHTGYGENLIRDKLRRNLFMLQARIASSGYVIQPIDYRYLMDCYYGLGDLTAAFTVSGICLEYSDKLTHELGYIYKIRAKSAIFLGKTRKEVEIILQEAQSSSDKLYFTLLRAAYLYEQGDLDAALPLAQDGLTALRKLGMTSPAYEFIAVAQRIIAEGNSR